VDGLKCVGYNEDLQRRIARDAPAWDLNFQKEAKAQRSKKRAQMKTRDAGEIGPSSGKGKKSTKRAADGQPAPKATKRNKAASDVRQSSSDNEVINVDDDGADDDDYIPNRQR
jgi:hypothetical protein